MSNYTVNAERIGDPYPTSACCTHPYRHPDLGPINEIPPIHWERIFNPAPTAMQHGTAETVPPGPVAPVAAPRPTSFPHVCPLCRGTGEMVVDTGYTTTVANYKTTCAACHGARILWGPAT